MPQRRRARTESVQASGVQALGVPTPGAWACRRWIEALLAAALRCPEGAPWSRERPAPPRG